ncbi:methylmalonyl Co-A mutase-associated GTPase MeaB [Desulfoscipio gibsoniae]|uniref:LAO/AO transport system ATPase n=1 Tax=Desulfoscipio gibsoniae DSM 7213 TaxID=767817 RepID=R4KIJ6_9FIRM|nr:LAO/AO transport system ATPase [Desulfoscipio gibsoniae DSM 7213]
MQDLIDRFIAGETRALARLISLLENEDDKHEQILKELFKRTGQAYVIGFTGSPGAGKSSLVDQVVKQLRKAGNTVGIIAVDPTSPFTGGALLGDRIRMQQHALDKGVFIRSMGTRGSLGGLAKTTKDVVKAMDAFGFDRVIIETVGVGQAELDIMHVADSTVVVLTPGAGDAIQTIKAGIMEIADVFAVNKSDLPGADKIATEVEIMLDQRRDGTSWRPPVQLCSSLTGAGITELVQAIEGHRQHQLHSTTNSLKHRRQKRVRSETLDIVNYKWQQKVFKQMRLPGLVNELLDRVEQKELDYYTAAYAILEYVAANQVEGEDESRSMPTLSNRNVEVIFNHLQQLVDQLQKTEKFDLPDQNYQVYLHGEIYGISLALRQLYPGPGNWGEKAGLLIRPVLTEHQCDCQEKPNDQ